jgi:hypothetical protein
VSDAVTAECVGLYTRGATLDQVGEFVGMHATSVRARLLKAGVKMRPPGRREIDYAAAQECLDAGLSHRQTAVRVGCVHSAITNAIARGTLRRVRA